MDSKVLDIGCGTGIVTRQLKNHGLKVIGSDIDTKMIDVARAYNDRAEYVVAPSEQLPFGDDVFDVVTCFSAFHWFANKEAVSEIKRVTVSGGTLFIANREYNSFKEMFLRALGPFIEKSFSSVKRDYNPKTILETYEYNNIQEKSFVSRESLSAKEAVSYVQSTSLWNLVTDVKKVRAEEVLLAHFKSISIEGRTLRYGEIRTVLASAK